ncbi:hypothetical protein KUV89_02125 [Marinobacter hydrocarbonoclasticus]|nr:hypothetical protein [Marinobacter nauticus]
MTPMDALLERYLPHTGSPLFRDRRLQAELLDTADDLLDLGPDLYTLRQLESAYGLKRNWLAQTVIKLALSKRVLCDLCDPHRFTIVVPLYRSHQKLLSPQAHPDGEACIQRKLDQLQWLFSGAHRHYWQMVLVDERCPNQSGQIAARQIRERSMASRAEVLWIDEQVSRGLAPMILRDQPHRQGAGAVLGMWHAISQWGQDNHIVVVCDPRLDFNLGQIGLLSQPMQAGRLWAVVGSRYRPDSVSLPRHESSETLLVAYLWRRLLPQLNGVLDPFSGIKAYQGTTCMALVEGLSGLGASLDLELLLQAQLSEPESIREVPVAHMGSGGAGSDPLTLLRDVVRLYRRYLPQQPLSEQFAALVDQLDGEKWNRLASTMAGELAQQNLDDLMHRCVYSPQHLAVRMKSRG